MGRAYGQDALDRRDLNDHTRSVIMTPLSVLITSREGQEMYTRAANVEAFVTVMNAFIVLHRLRQVCLLTVSATRGQRLEADRRLLRRRLTVTRFIIRRRVTRYNVDFVGDRNRRRTLTDHGAVMFCGCEDALALRMYNNNLMVIGRLMHNDESVMFARRHFQRLFEALGPDNDLDESRSARALNARDVRRALDRDHLQTSCNRISNVHANGLRRLDRLDLLRERALDRFHSANVAQHNVCFLCLEQATRHVGGNVLATAATWSRCFFRVDSTRLVWSRGVGI